MDPEHAADMLKHLEKQNEIFMEVYRAMSHELHTLQVEEEMLLHKLYQVMSAQGLIKKKKDRKETKEDLIVSSPE